MELTFKKMRYRTYPLETNVINFPERVAYRAEFEIRKVKDGKIMTRPGGFIYCESRQRMQDEIRVKQTLFSITGSTLLVKSERPVQINESLQKRIQQGKGMYITSRFRDSGDFNRLA